MHHTRRRHEAKGVTRCHGDCCLSGAAPEAANVGVVDVRDAAVVAGICDFGFADCEPVCRFRFSVDDEAGEFIWGSVSRWSSASG
jgi:hypothetical protein